MTLNIKIADRLKKSKEITEQRYANFRRELEMGGFVLPDEVRAQLERGGMRDGAVAELLLEWDGLFLHRDDYRGQDAAHIIRTVPNFWEAIIETCLPFSYSPDWRDRTLDTFVMRHWQEMWKSEKEPDSLLDLVRRYMIEFLPTIADDAPTVADVLPHLRERPRLSSVYCIMRDMDAFKPEPLVRRTIPTLESVEAELIEVGADYLRDLRPLPYPSEILSDPLWSEHDWFVCAACRLVGIREAMTLRSARGDVAKGGVIYPDADKNLVVLAHCPVCGTTVPGHPEASDPIYARLNSLGELVFRSIGQTPEHSPDIATAIAHEYELLPAQVDRLIAGKPAGEVAAPEPCPLTEGCPTFCGQRQSEGLSNRAFTRDGRWQSCEFVSFRQSEASGTVGAKSDEAAISRAIAMYKRLKSGSPVQAGLSLF